MGECNALQHPLARETWPPAFGSPSRKAARLEFAWAMADLGELIQMAVDRLPALRL